MPIRIRQVSQLRLVIYAVAVLLVATALAHADYAAGKAAFDRGDWDTALREWRPLAESGDAAAQNNIGFMYRYGRGVAINPVEAVKWYRRAAEQGHPAAQFNLGLMYDNGLGVPQDFAIAAEWFQRAAQQEVARAQTFLGLMYRSGKGREKDLIQALLWLNLAAAQGDELARTNRTDLRQQLTPAEIGQADDMAAAWRPSRRPSTSK